MQIKFDLTCGYCGNQTLRMNIGLIEGKYGPVWCSACNKSLEIDVFANLDQGDFFTQLFNMQLAITRA